MTTQVFTLDRLFAELPHSFDDYPTFEQAFLERFNAHRFDFPIGYGWREALNWGLRHDVVKLDGKRIVVQLVEG
jgi:hypothetical protein